MLTNTAVALKPIFLVIVCCISLNMHFLQSLIKLIIFIINIPRYLLFIHLFKILPSSLYDLLKLSKTTSPHKLFPSDCIALYIVGS